MIVSNLKIVLGTMYTLTVLILLIYDYGISFHVFISSLISFINVIQFSVYISYIVMHTLNILILYPETLSSINSNSFWQILQGFLYIMCHLQIVMVLLFLFEHYSFLFFWLTSLSKIFSTMLSKSGKNRHPYLVTNLRGKVLTLKN